MDDKMDGIKELKNRIVTWASGELDEGKCNDPTVIHAFGEIIDMVKDLAEAEKLCREAEYYKSVHEAMEEYGDDPRMGYPRRRNRMGQFSKTGRSGYPDDDMRGYTPDGDGSRSGNRMNRSSDGNGRMGYSHDRFDPRMEMGADNRRMREDWEDERYGKPFNKYRMAKRHFAESKSDKDKQEMKDYANEHVAESIQTLREIWDSADQDLRVRMKSDMTKLIGDMKP